MSRNDSNHTFSEPNWGGQAPGPHGTGFHQNLASEGRHGERGFQANRWARRGPAPVATPFVLMRQPKILGETEDFTRGWIEAEAENGHPLARAAGALAGGIVGAAVAHHYMNRRSR